MTGHGPRSGAACGDLPDILNWRRVDAHVTLSGQPTAAQLRDIAASGVTHVINLGPHENPKALPQEAAILAGLGVRYTYIPVDFDAPGEADYAAFCTALDLAAGETLHIHCIYNARVSAFMLRRAQDGRGGSVARARALMDSIWRPGGVWATFLGDTVNQPHPNRYAGHDY